MRLAEANLVPRVLVTLVQWRNGQQGPLGGSDPPWQDSWTSDSTAHVHVSLNYFLRMSWQYCTCHGRSLPPQRSLLPIPLLDKGNEDSGNEIRLRLDYILTDACSIRTVEAVGKVALLFPDFSRKDRSDSAISTLSTLPPHYNTLSPSLHLLHCACVSVAL